MAQYDFMQNYTGPNGPHLNFLTRYTMTRKDEDRLRGEGIHPRGKPAKNTCKPSTGQRQARAILAIEAHLKRHPRDRQSEGHLARLRRVDVAA